MLPYPGQVISGNCEKEIRFAISLHWGALCKQFQTIKSRLPSSLELERLVCDRCKLPMMADGAEAWRLTKHLKTKHRSV